MRLITIATDLKNPFLTRLLIPSCAAAGVELTVLHPHRPHITFTDKRHILLEHLTRCGRRDELVMFTDAYDAVLLRGQEEIERAYARFTQRVVFSAEQNSWPLGVVGLALHDGPPATRFPYLNSGGFIAPAGDLLDLCEKYPKPPSDRFELLARLRARGYNTDQRYRFSDQYYWTLVQLLEPCLIGVDQNASLFECYGRPVPDVVVREVVREDHEFREQGRAADLYQRERARLTARLRNPSDAAHLHFAGRVAKAVVLDLLDEGQLPGWLGAVLHPRPAADEVVRVQDV